MSNAINSAMARTDWKLLAQQKQALVRLLMAPSRLTDAERKNLDGILRWLDAIQAAAQPTAQYRRASGPRGRPI